MMLPLLVLSLLFSPAERTVRLREAEAHAQRLRRLPLREEIRYRRIGRGRLSRLLDEKIEEYYPGEEMETLGETLLAFGLLREPVDLRRVVREFLSTDSAALYDHKEEVLYEIVGSPFFGPIGETVLVHEITHALQDQNFDLDSLPLELRENDDRAFAALALVEGDAMLVSFLAWVGRFRPSDAGCFAEAFLSVPPPTGVPEVVVENLLFPYISGFPFALSLYGRGGWNALDGAFRNPPSSTEQVLHPGKYPADRPVSVPLPSGALAALEGWTLRRENVLGELNTYLLFRPALGEERAREASEGWGGDGYALFSLPGGEFLLCWLTVWDSASDAAEFLQSCREWFRMRYSNGREGDWEGGLLIESPSVKVYLRGERRTVLLLLGREKDAFSQALKSVLDVGAGRLPGPVSP